MDTIIVLICLLVGLGMALALSRTSSNTVKSHGFTPSPTVRRAKWPGTVAGEQNLESQLLIMVRGDHEVMDRLVRYEQKRFPYEDRSRLLQRAIDRWLHDNR